ncbi:plasmid mobilization protein [Megamonas hypermegale]|uniref:plasmid mobilization protein n=1 Tax=Megamonas hypermegale TaxID=158847 RepID=UPI001957D874|nr:hypothetical protein [Megamonas hypermegale]MBM6833900.1 hypothetical protein [Megamonas hypermegale]
MNSKLKKKDKIINFRVSETQKDKIMQNAKQLNMSVGEYLIYLDEHRIINIIDGGKDLAKEVYMLNKNLSVLEKYPFVEVNQVRNLLSEYLMKLNQQMKG